MDPDQIRIRKFGKILQVKQKSTAIVGNNFANNLRKNRKNLDFLLELLHLLFAMGAEAQLLLVAPQN
jgi:hypothetical protein